MHIERRVLLHVVDEATHYTAAKILKRQRSSDVWKALLRCWSRIYLGPPDHMRVDQGSNFVARAFLECAEAQRIQVLQALIESPSTMAHVERYHAPLRAAFLKIRHCLPSSESDDDCLQMALKAVNDTIGPEGLCPTLLVYGSLPRPPRQTPSETQLQKARAIDSCMDTVRKIQTRKRIEFGLKHRGSGKAHENSYKLRLLPAGSPVYVYRTKSKIWEGPYPFIQIEGHTVAVQLPSGRKIFCSHVVKSEVPAA